MVVVGGRIEGFKGNMWVYHWQIGQQGKTAKAEVAARGGWPSPIEVDGCRGFSTRFFKFSNEPNTISE